MSESFLKNARGALASMFKAIGSTLSADKNLFMTAAMVKLTQGVDVSPEINVKTMMARMAERGWDFKDVEQIHVPFSQTAGLGASDRPVTVFMAEKKSGPGKVHKRESAEWFRDLADAFEIPRDCIPSYCFRQQTGEAFLEKAVFMLM